MYWVILVLTTTEAFFEKFFLKIRLRKGVCERKPYESKFPHALDLFAKNSINTIVEIPKSMQTITQTSELVKLSGK